MGENTPLKRQREEEIVVEEDEILKRQKSYKDIITLLEEEEDIPNEDVTSLISTLQEEISTGSGHTGPYETDPDNPTPVSFVSNEEEVEGEKLMRHLLEASDDELGIPNTTTDGFDAVVGGHVDGGDFSLGEGLWEFEDREAANYYNLLQSEIFL